MARERLMSSSSMFSMPQVVGIAAMTVALCAFAMFKCTSDCSRNWRKRTYSYGGGFSDPVIQYYREPRFLMAEDDQGDASLWQRNILMGGKCQMPDFSGVIVYDVTGNFVPPRKASQSLT